MEGIGVAFNVDSFSSEPTEPTEAAEAAVAAVTAEARPREAPSASMGQGRVEKEKHGKEGVKQFHIINRFWVIFILEIKNVLSSDMLDK